MTQNSFVEALELIDAPSIRPAEEKAASSSSAAHFRSMDLIPALLLRSHDFYRDFGWRGS